MVNCSYFIDSHRFAFLRDVQTNPPRCRSSPLLNRHSVRGVVAFEEILMREQAYVSRCVSFEEMDRHAWGQREREREGKEEEVELTL